MEGLAKRRAGVASLDSARMAAELRRRANDVKGLLRRNVAGASGVLKQLLAVRFCASRWTRGRGYHVRGSGSYAEILPGALPTKVVTPGVTTRVGPLRWPSESTCSPPLRSDLP